MLNLENGAQTHFGVEDNVYVMELMIPPGQAKAEDFPRQGR